MRNNYYLTTLSIDGIDVRDSMLSVDIVQDINSNYVKGVITVHDVGNIESLSLVGGEFISLEFETDDDSWSWDLSVLYVEIPTIKENEKYYTIHFVDDIYFNLHDNYSFSKSDKISNIIKDFYTELNPSLELECEETLYVNDFIFPNWDGNRIINFLENRSVSINNGTLFKFYRTNDKHNFKCLETLVNDEPIEELYTVDVETVSTVKKKTNVYNNISFIVNGNKSDYEHGYEGVDMNLIDVFEKSINLYDDGYGVKFLKYNNRQQNEYTPHFEDIIRQRLLNAGMLNNSILSLETPPSSKHDLGNVFKVNIFESSIYGKTEKSTLTDNYLCTKVVYKLGKELTQTMVLQRIKKDYNDN